MGILIVYLCDSLLQCSAPAESELKTKNEHCFYSTPIPFESVSSKTLKAGTEREIMAISTDAGTITTIDEVGRIHRCIASSDALDSSSLEWMSFEDPDYFDASSGLTDICVSSTADLHTASIHSESKGVMIYNAEGKVSFRGFTRNVPTAVDFGE